MLRFVRKLFTFYIVLMVSILVCVLLYEINLLHSTSVEMERLITRGHYYCTQQTQDIDIVTQQLETNSRSRSAYSFWLDAVSEGRGFTGMTISQNGSQTGTSPVDDNLKDIITFLEDNKDKGYSPLNFGMTYLDPVKLEEDMQNFVVTSIKEFNNFLSPAKFGFYRVDPNTVNVDVTLDMELVDISNLTSNEESKYSFLQLFGIDVDDPNVPEHLRKSELEKIVKYNIQYDIYWDYIPTNVFFSVFQPNVQQYRSWDIPPEHIYFPHWYLEDSSVNPDSDEKISYARAKFITGGVPFTYTYDYVLTH